VAIIPNLNRSWCFVLLTISVYDRNGSPVFIVMIWKVSTKSVNLFVFEPNIFYQNISKILRNTVSWNLMLGHVFFPVLLILTNCPVRFCHAFMYQLRVVNARFYWFPKVYYTFFLHLSLIVWMWICIYIWWSQSIWFSFLYRSFDMFNEVDISTCTMRSVDCYLVEWLQVCAHFGWQITFCTVYVPCCLLSA